MRSVTHTLSDSSRWMRRTTNPNYPNDGVSGDWPQTVTDGYLVLWWGGPSYATPTDFEWCPTIEHAARYLDARRRNSARYASTLPMLAATVTDRGTVQLSEPYRWESDTPGVIDSYMYLYPVRKGWVRWDYDDVTPTHILTIGRRGGVHIERML